eukprot:1105857-Rhodomonas_salina.2
MHCPSLHLCLSTAHGVPRAPLSMRRLKYDRRPSFTAHPPLAGLRLSSRITLHHILGFPLLLLCSDSQLHAQDRSDVRGRALHVLPADESHMNAMQTLARTFRSPVPPVLHSTRTVVLALRIWTEDARRRRVELRRRV